MRHTSTLAIRINCLLTLYIMNTHRYEQRQGLTFAEKEHKETQTCRNERKQELANSEMNDAGKKQE